MINHKFRWIQFGLIAALLPALATVQVGCSEDEPEPVTRKTDYGPPEPEMPDAALIASELMVDSKLSVDAMIMVDCTPEHVRAAIGFADAFARGDAEALRPMLDGTSKGVLDDLEAHGWAEEVDLIQAVTLQQASHTDAGDTPLQVTFSVSKRGGDRVVLNWGARKRGDSWVFSPTTDIAALEAEMAEAANEEDAEESDVSGSGGERDRNRPNPNDPRPRVPRQRPAPTDPGSPGSPG